MMKKSMLFSVLGVLAMGLTACGGVPTVKAALGNEESVVAPDTLRYVQDGKTLSSEAVKALEEKHGDLFFLMDSNAADSLVQVFTDKAKLERTREEIKAQTICIGTQLNTFVYDLPNYAGAFLSMAIGASIPNLAVVGGGSLNNDISSIRAADCVWTYVYELPGLTGTFVSMRGDNVPTLPGIFNNSISSIEVIR